MHVQLESFLFNLTCASACFHKCVLQVHALCQREIDRLWDFRFCSEFGDKIASEPQDKSPNNEIFLSGEREKVRMRETHSLGDGEEEDGGRDPALHGREAASGSGGAEPRSEEVPRAAADA